MSTLRKTLLFLFFYFYISNIFVQNANATLNSGDHATPLFVQNFSVSGQDTGPKGITFNNDGTKMYVTGTTNDKIYEYTLTSAFDISTATYRGFFNFNGNSFSVKFNNDGTKMFTVSYWDTGAAVKEFLLGTPFDITSISGNGTTPETTFNFKPHDNKPFGLDFNNDGTKMFVTGNDGDDINEFSLNVGFDFSEGINFVQSKDLTHPMSLATNEDEPFGIEFNQDGTTMFVIGSKGNDVNQYSLSTAFDISTLSFVGGLHLNTQEVNPSGIAFSASGIKMFIVGDDGDEVNEYHLKCPYNLFKGKCNSITENKVRTGIALGQIEIAKRTIDHSVDTALNRLKWIRRNKDKQNLSNLNIDFNFTNQRLASLTEVIRASAANKKNKNKDENVFYWSEGSISVGRIGDTSISSTKKIDMDALTFGVDKFTDNNGITGLAFRLGRNNVDVGTAGSNLDTDTYNITFYSTSPIESDTKFLNKFIGFGKLSSDLLTVLDGQNLTADRSGHQIYGTIRIKDEIKKNNLTFIPSGRFDIGHTILGSYKESGTGAIEVKKQHIRSKKIRASLAAVEDISNDRYNIKRHGKIEYVADIDRSSNFKYTYVDDGSVDFNDTLHLEAFHNINGEIGIDVVLPDSFSIFLIYERNQAIDTGHTDKVHIAIGYLPNKETNYAFTIEGSENLLSKLELKKNINGFNLGFNIKDDLANSGDYKEANFTLNKVF